MNAEQFHDSIDRSAGPDACWPWTRGISSTGYGKVRWNGRQDSAHRVALALHQGRPVRQAVRHRCDNRPCCNPAHLLEGTPAQNTADARSRGRLSSGEHRYNAKLTYVMVAWLRWAREHCGITYVQAAYIAGVSKACAAAVLSGRAWRTDGVVQHT